MPQDLSLVVYVSGGGSRHEKACFRRSIALDFAFLELKSFRNRMKIAYKHSRWEGSQAGSTAGRGAARS